MVGIRALNHRDTDRAFAEEGVLTFWRQSLREGLTRSVDTFAIREYNMRMIKGQDIVVLAVLMEDGFDKLAYAELGKAACLSASETHAAVKRLQESALVNGDRRPMKRNAIEFLVHGLRYAFPMRPTGRLVRGTPTAYAAPIASEYFATTGLKPVWNGSSGDVYGQGYDPVYPTAPEAARRSSGLYDRLAVIDMLRGGRIRERQFAERKLQEMMA